jgi:hypothetical protein
VTKDDIEPLVQKVQGLADPKARRAALDLLQAVMDLHAAGIEHMMEIVADSSFGAETVAALGNDRIVSSLLLLHDLHPLDLETRVARALDRPDFRSHGASVELIAATEGLVRVRIEGGPGLRGAVEAALAEAAPDAADIQVEGGTSAVSGFVPLAALTTG